MFVLLIIKLTEIPVHLRDPLLKSTIYVDAVKPLINAFSIQIHKGLHKSVQNRVLRLKYEIISVIIISSKQRDIWLIMQQGRTEGNKKYEPDYLTVFPL